MTPSLLKNKLTIFIIIFLIFIAAMIAYSTLNKPSTPTPETTKILLETSMGNITIELYNDVPITAQNFKNLTQNGIYDNTTFHRVVANFVIQGGDPTGTGYGDPSIPNIQDELPNRHSNTRGSIAMANSEGVPNSGSSQFFINLIDNSANLDSKHPVFGMVISGMDVVDAIGRVPVGANEKPLTPVKLINAIIL